MRNSATKLPVHHEPTVEQAGAYWRSQRRQALHLTVLSSRTRRDRSCGCAKTTLNARVQEPEPHADARFSQLQVFFLSQTSTVANHATEDQRLNWSHKAATEMTRRRDECVQHEQSELQLHALNAESHVSEHQKAAASLRDKLSRVNQQNERYEGFCGELQSTQSFTSIHTSRFKRRVTE